ncbi:MAG TPA: hypothetical protein VFC46_08925, partial [Humisphaera sp.]|nr:hypothetical protein [Humisphaera sp.]
VDTKKVEIIVSGVDTKGLKRGDQKYFDRVFIISDKTADGGGTVFIATPHPSDADRLFDAIVPLRDSLPAADMPKGDKAE